MTYHGPGSEASTQRALMAIPDLPGKPDILDVGCGPGRQTLHLARQTAARVIAVDVLRESLEALSRRTRERGLMDHITPVRASMTQLCFDDDCIDLIWSEGAIYCMGFAAGLEAWRRFLRPGGCLAVTELSWLNDDAPGAVRAFWEKHYPAMSGVHDNLEAIDRAGYERIDNFVLPESDWWDHYYAELAAEIQKILHQYKGRDIGEGRAVIELCNEEMEVLRNSQGSYGYVFYIVRKPD